MKGKIIAVLSLFLFFSQNSFSQCMADAGTSTVISDGNGNFPFVLCFGDMFEIVSNDDYTLPPATAPNVAGIMWGLYLCPPTDPVDPGADPCWDMSYWTGEDFPQTNDGSLVAFLGGNNTFWIAPIASDAVQLPNHDQDGDGCVDVGLGEIYQITLLDDITFNVQNIDNCNGEVTIQIMGGYPEEFAGNYTVTNTGGGNLMQSGTSGEIITITNLGNGQPYSFQVTEDGNGCSQPFAGGTMTLISEDASFLFPPFCPDEPNGPSFVATPGGTFVFNPAPGDGATINPNTGEITGATPGMTYFVEYTTGGACPTTGMPQPVMAQIVPPAPMVNPNSYIGCQGDPINVIPNGTGGNFNFYNDPALNNLVFTGPFFDASNFVVPGITTTFYVTESNGPCEGPPTSFDVLVQPANPPTLTPNTVTVCAGDPVTIIPGSNNANSTNTFNFYGNAALTNLLFTGSIYTFNPTMNTTIFVTEEINGCESMPVAFTINIDPTPPAPNVTSPVDICVNEAAPNLMANGTGGTITWYDVDPAVGNPIGIATGPTFTPPINTAVAGSTTYWVTESSPAGCEGPASSITVNVNAAPAAPNAVDPPAICVGENVTPITANGTGGTINWYDADPTMGNPVPIFSGNPFNPPVNTNQAGNTMFWVTETNATGCESIPTVITVTINQAPAPPIATDPAPICVGEAIPALTATGSGGILNWYGADPTTGNPPVLGSGSPFTPGVSNATPGTFDFWVTETANGNCEGPPTMVTLTISFSPAVPNVTDPTPICVGENIPSITANGGTGIINWYDTDPTMGNPFPIFSGNPFTPPIDNNTAGNTTFWVTEENAQGCESDPTIVIVSVLDDLPAPAATDPAAICIGEAAPDLTANGNGGTLSWYDADPAMGNPASIGTGSPFTPGINTNTAGTFDFWVTETNASGCESNAQMVTITINDEPSAPAATDPAEICTDEAVPGLTATGSGGTLTWYDADPAMGSPASIGTGSPFTPGINTNTAGTFDFWVTETNTTGCEGEATQVTITINDEPTAPAATDPAEICTGETAPDLTATGSGGTLTWYDADPSMGNPASIGTGSPFTPGINTNTAGTFDFWVTETSAAGCEGEATQITITINEGPDAPMAADPAAICIGAAVPDLTASGSGGTLTWYDADPSMGSPASIGTGSPFTPGINTNTAGTFDFWVTETSATACEGAPSMVTITIVAEPLAPVANDPNSICIDDPIPNLTATGSGGTLTWYDSDPAMGSPVSVGTGSPFMPSIDNTVAGSTTFWVTETNATGCEGEATEVTITINELPTIMVETDCAADLSSYSVQVTTDGDAVSSTEGTVTDQGGGVFLVEGIDVNNDVTITATNTTTNCESTLEVQAPDCNCPGVDAPISDGDEEICQGDDIPTLSVTVNAGETVDWYDAAVDGTLLLVGSTTFTPTAAGTYYAEARTIDNNCTSTRTAVTLTINPFPSIVLQESTCSADLLSYDVDIIFADADQIMVSEGLVMDNGNGSFNISGIDINNDLTIIASNSATGCSEEFQINPINCDCPNIDAPINDGDQTICEDEMIPSLSTTVGTDETVDWYDSPIGGTLLLTNSLTFTPTEAGIYYAEARNTINNCISTRTAIELTINPLPTIAMAETICADDFIILRFGDHNE